MHARTRVRWCIQNFLEYICGMHEDNWGVASRGEGPTPPPTFFLNYVGEEWIWSNFSHFSTNVEGEINHIHVDPNLKENTSPRFEMNKSTESSDIRWLRFIIVYMIMVVYDRKRMKYVGFFFVIINNICLAI